LEVMSAARRSSGGDGSSFGELVTTAIRRVNASAMRLTGRFYRFQRCRADCLRLCFDDQLMCHESVINPTAGATQGIGDE
jgi:hypothetical protein